MVETTIVSTIVTDAIALWQIMIPGWLETILGILIVIKVISWLLE